jgi:type I restriction enzyme S subunit
MNIDRDGRLDLSVVKYVSPDNLLRIQCGDVLFNNTNSPELVGKTTSITVDLDLAFSNHMTRLRPSEGVHPEFLAHQLHFLWMAGYFRYLCVKHVNQASVSSEMLALKVPAVLPPSREQIRIVEEIDKQFTRLEAGVGALKRVQANLKRYRAAVLKAAVEGCLVPAEAELARRDGRSYEPASELLRRILAERKLAQTRVPVPPVTQPLLTVKPVAQPLLAVHPQAELPVSPKAKYKEPVGPDSTNLPKLPEGWAWATMPQLGELSRGKSKHRPRDDVRLFGGPYPFIQTGDVKHSDGYIRNHSQTYNATGLAQSRLWPAGTLCITIAANIAESGILTYAVCFPDSVVGFRTEGHPATLRFIQFFLETAKAELSRFAPATAQKNINLATLYGLAIPLPPLSEQHRIVTEVERRLSVVDELEMQVEANLKRAERLRRAILKRAFEGKLVPQDPNDEPASVLLERMRAAKSTGKSACATGAKATGMSACATSGTATLGCAGKRSI